VVRNPRHGYGKGLNPCIDCRIYLLRRAKEYMVESGADFVFTGEVLGQRPMSQRRDAMRVIERESGLEDLLVRPLSAQFFAPTLPEREGGSTGQSSSPSGGVPEKNRLSLPPRWTSGTTPAPPAAAF
jgi:tRNA-uridine 2-sulfurtransferase